ncbi:unnamed protein product [Anisakis simplex]|uniref:Uncharacterized protein n=1 Tax=Anisakis simplex TaxID=6269 RepID=A0A0M3JFX9_ANISI|nr:unnamed protein product [Anisakis simplex]
MQHAHDQVQQKLISGDDDRNNSSDDNSKSESTPVLLLITSLNTTPAPSSVIPQTFEPVPTKSDPSPEPPLPIKHNSISSKTTSSDIISSNNQLSTTLQPDILQSTLAIIPVTLAVERYTYSLVDSNESLITYNNTDNKPYSPSKLTAADSVGNEDSKEKGLYESQSQTTPQQLPLWPDVLFQGG